MDLHLRIGLLGLVLVGYGIVPVRAETPEEWVKLGARVHGGFGAFIPVGIRIGEDAMRRLNAQPRELSVVYYSGEGVPCPCSVDGVMLAVSASPRTRFCPGRCGEIANWHFRRSCHPAPQGRRWIEIHCADVPHGQAWRNQSHHPGPACPLQCGDGHRRSVRGRAGEVIS